MPGSNVTQLQRILGRNTHQPLTQYFAHLKKNPSDFVPVFGGAFARTTREHLGVNWGLLW